LGKDIESKYCLSKDESVENKIPRVEGGGEKRLHLARGGGGENREKNALVSLGEPAGRGDIEFMFYGKMTKEDMGRKCPS